MNKNEPYNYEIIEEKIYNGTKHEFYFKNNEGKLLSYIVLHINELGFGENKYFIGSIEHVTAANGYKFIPDYIKKIYDNHGLPDNNGIKYFGEKALNDVLNHAKQKFTGLEIVVVKGYIENTEAIMNLVNRVKNKFNSVLEIMGPGDFSICTLKI